MNHAVRSGWTLIGVAIVISLTGCGQEKNTKVKAATKMRSTGAQTLSLAHQQVSSYFLNEGVSMMANSAVSIESYKVPVDRINLIVFPESGGYNETSPNLYACPNAADADCLVDLSQPISIDNLLQGAKTAEIDVGDNEKSYNGVAVEFCHEFNHANAGSIEASYYEARVTASVTLGTTILYTNKANGVSTTGPAEEVSIKVRNTGCGVQSRLFEPVTLEPGKDVTVILYADPNGAVFGTDSTAAANSACVGTDSQAICTDAVTVFGTVDSAAPTIERYRMTMATAGYSDLMMSVVFNSADRPFGAMLRSIYTNVSATRTLHGSASFNRIVQNADGTLTFQTQSQTGTISDAITNFKRAAHSGSIKEFVDTAMDYTASPL